MWEQLRLYRRRHQGDHAVRLHLVGDRLYQKSAPTVFRRRFSQEVRDKALMIFLMGLSVVLVSTFLLCMLEPDASFIQVLMETTSAFATVGLSCGLTGGLSGLSKLVLILTMYIGRLGPLTVATLWIVQGRRNSEILRPEETISVG
ncbi:MAG: potassium transporter TrkG [Ruminococcus callidus]